MPVLEGHQTVQSFSHENPIGRWDRFGMWLGKIHKRLFPNVRRKPEVVAQWAHAAESTEAPPPPSIIDKYLRSLMPPIPAYSNYYFHADYYQSAVLVIPDGKGGLIKSTTPAVLIHVASYFNAEAMSVSIPVNLEIPDSLEKLRFDILKAMQIYKLLSDISPSYAVSEEFKQWLEKELAKEVK